MACVSIRIRRDTYANWYSQNPVLKEGEMSFVTDRFMIKFGDGRTPWRDLTCVIDIQSLQTALSDYSANISEMQELIQYVEENTEGQLQQIQDAIDALDGIIGDRIGINDATPGASTTYSSTKLERVFESLRRDSGYFKIVETLEERDAIPADDRKIGMICYVSGDGENGTTYQLIGTTENTGWEIFSSGSGGGSGGNVPTLSYVDEFPQGRRLYYSVGDNCTILVKFSSTTYGDCTLRIYKDNVLFKTMTTAKGTIAIDLGTLTTEGTSVYRISGSDYMGIAAPDDLTFTVVCGGLTLSSTFGTMIENTVFETNTSIIIPYDVRCSDTSQTVKLLCTIKEANAASPSTEIINTGSYQQTGNWFVGLKPRGTYTVTLQAYTGTGINDSTALVSPQLTYVFNVLADGEISIVSELVTSGINTNTSLSIPYRVSGKNVSTLLMRGTLYSVSNYGTASESLTAVKTTPTSGVQSTVGITSYWFVGRLEAGTYKYEMRSYTLDSQKSSVDIAQGYFTVESASYSGLQPVSENLVAWFDANDMRNSVENPDEWNNKVSAYPQYQIKLHNLNYNTNGWKHVDESLSDSESGEMMLKFTGDSYGELINKNTGARICPLEGFNDATNGYAMEVAFRTRCVGEMNSRVITCQKGIDISSPGFAVTHEDLYIGSSAQSTKLGFAEDEWIHATFVIDRNIRTLAQVGLNNIENMNPVYSMRIYINGVFCSCTALTNDRFVDSLGNANPLILNAALVNGVVQNFGECEIKMIRLYNRYLTSSEVLNNYISSIFDLAEQSAIKDKNDLSIAHLPIITFKRKNQTNNSTFQILNSITDKKTSKKTFVDCVIEIQNPDGTVTVWENAEVFLQGTSSLQYPVKNYKIKLYTDATKDKKMKVQLQDDWKPESTFTLKCDYMEGSHLNNTPTADFYNHLIDLLGGNSPAKANGYKDAIDGFPVIVYYTDDETDSTKLTLVGSYMFNIDKAGKTLGFEIDSDVNGRTVNKMQSYEGVANSTDTAGCFYSLSESINHVYQYYVDDCYQEAYLKYLEDNGLSASSFSFEQYQQTSDYANVPIMTFEEFQADYSEYDYVLDDFEPRFDYYELEDIENPTDADYETALRPLIDLVNGVSSSVNNGTFKTWVSNHFDFTYALAYYLQMMVFGQVDNAGKNSMWDTWDGNYWYVRPYDMDTQCGLSNTGTETIGVDAEMIPSLSPSSATGTFAAYTTNELTELRYASYNTKTSKFWNTFGREYINEIKAAYQNLRKTVYDLDYIMEYYKARTTDLIGEIYYNKDMAAKYLTQTTASNTEYLKMLHGNRLQRFKQWMKQRLDFCDTLFDYRYSEENTNSINGEISLRTDAYLLTNNGTEATDDASTLRAYIGILTYTPQYVTVSVGSGQDAIITAYVSQNSTYIDPDTNREVQGTLFTFPIKATDKELTISASGGIQLLNKLEDLNVRDLTIANATKILKLDLSGSSRMTKLTMGNNKYLRELNCSGSIQLGTESGGQVLNLTGCKNLQTLDITNTKIVTVNFAEGGNLKTATLSRSNINSLLFKSLEFLTDINIDGCENITEFTIDSCSAITDISLADSPIIVFNAINCESLESVDVSNCRVLETFELTGCPNVEELIMRNNNGSMMNDLQLYTLYNLKTLNVSNSSSLENIRFPKYASQEETDRVVALKEAHPTWTDADCNAVLWDGLTTFTITSSSLKYIQYGSADIAAANKVCDMSQLTNLSAISFQNCTSVEKVENLNYTARSVASMFSRCTNLKRVSGYLKCTNNASSLFAYCLNLTDINDLTFDFAGVTTLSSIFACVTNGGGRGKATYTMLRKILHACDESLTTIDSMIQGCDAGTSLPDDLFSTTPNIRSANSAFYSTTMTSLTKEFFDYIPNLQNANMMFYACSAITSIDQDIFENLTKLTTVSRMFANCTGLVHFIDEDCNIFANNPLITTTYAMFHNCNKMLNTNGLEGMLDPLENLTDASYMFYGCAAMTGTLPNGFFSENENLTTANGVFSGCSGLTELPARLFRKNKTDTNNVPYLTSMKSVFYNCTNLGGVVTSDFFAGAPNIRTIGIANTDYIPNSSNRYTLYGFFGNTKVEGYFEDFLSKLPMLTDVSYLFYHASENRALKYCYYDNNGVDDEYGNSLSIALFENNTLLQNTSYAFQNCAGLTGCIPYKTVNGNVVSIFESCKNNIVNASYMFAGCSMLTGNDIDNSAMVGVADSLFTNCPNLQNVAGFFYNNTNHTFSIPSNMFAGCTSLVNTSYLFYNCALLQGSIPVNMFNSCRQTLQNVSYMFYGCLGLTGELPTGTKDENGNITQKGFLADCLNLQNASYCFYDCEYLTGGFPEDMFYTSSITDRYTALTTVASMFYKCRGLNQAYYDENTGLNYLVAPNFFTKCVALTSVNDVFRECYNIPACNVPETLFARQVQLVTAERAFFGIDHLTGTINATFMANCIATLESVYALFAFTNITQVVATFLHGSAKNTKLKYVGALFYECANLTGNLPAFYDGNIFSKIEGSQNGYFGAIHSCTGLSNYNSINALDANYTTSLNIWRR